MLKRTYLNHGEDGYVLLCQDTCHEIMDKLDASEQFNNYSDFWNHGKWLVWIVNSMTSNVVNQDFNVVYKKKKMVRSTMMKRKNFLTN
jgi:hypothetical protein